MFCACSWDREPGNNFEEGGVFDPSRDGSWAAAEEWEESFALSIESRDRGGSEAW